MKCVTVRDNMSSTPKMTHKIVIKKTFLFARGQRLQDEDTRVDALLRRMTSAPDVATMRYYQGLYVPDVDTEAQLGEGVGCKVTELVEKDENLERLTLEVSSRYRTAHDLTQFVEECNRDYQLAIQNKLGDKLYVFEQVSAPVQHPRGFSTPLVFNKQVFRSNRSLDNVFFEQRDALRRRLEFFQTRKDWYDAKGVPHALGLLFHGEGGTGKSSTIKALANATRRHIVSVHLDAITTKTQLRQLLFEDTINVVEMERGMLTTEAYRIPVDKRLIVFEDVDAASQLVLDREFLQPVIQAKQPRFEEDWEALGESTRVAEEDGDKLTLAAVLGYLDGTTEMPGRMLIMTSNYPERLDKALVRKGRIDLHIEFKLASAAITIEMFEAFYDVPFPEPLQEKLQDYRQSPAEVSAVLLKNFDNPTAAAKELCQL